MKKAWVELSALAFVLGATSPVFAAGQLSFLPTVTAPPSTAARHFANPRFTPAGGPTHFEIQGYVLEINVDELILEQTVDEGTFKELVQSGKAARPLKRGYPPGAQVLVREYKIVHRIQLPAEWKQKIDELKRFLSRNVTIEASGSEWGAKTLHAIWKTAD